MPQVPQVRRAISIRSMTARCAGVAWRFGAEDARRISQPVLYLGGTASGPWFAQVRQLVLAWLPQAEDVMFAGADHSLALTHAAQLAAALKTFLRRYTIRT